MMGGGGAGNRQYTAEGMCSAGWGKRNGDVDVVRRRRGGGREEKQCNRATDSNRAL